MTLYATLHDVRRELNADKNFDDARVLRLLRVASRRLDSELDVRRRPLFLPVSATRKYPMTSERVNSALGTFYVGEPFQELVSVTAGSTALTLGTGVEAYADNGGPPYMHLAIVDSCQSWYGYANENNNRTQVQIGGIWAVHRDYANAWPKVDDLALAINSSETTIKVADVDGEDVYGLTPRLSAGNVIRITTNGSTEFMEVLSTSTENNTAKVRRGILGTTAIAHDLGDDVHVWQVEDQVRQAIARQVGLMYARRGAYTSVEVTNMGTEIRFPTDLLSELRAIIQEYAYGR
jgi:hypothetical protein